jgi:hypothetical protein
VKCATEMASGGMIYTTSFMTTGIGVQKLLGEDTHVDTQTPGSCDLVMDLWHVNK